MTHLTDLGRLDFSGRDRGVEISSESSLHQAMISSCSRKNKAEVRTGGGSEMNRK